MKILCLFVLFCVTLRDARAAKVQQGCSALKSVAPTERCVTFVCKTDKEGNHVFTTDDEINKRCDECAVWNDPHFRTFDADPPLYYNWHDTCRYSLAEYVQTWGGVNSQPPQFGVYSDFKPCWSGAPPPSCLDVTSYQLSEGASDIVHVKHSSIFQISNNAFSDSMTITGSNPVQVKIGSTYYDLLAWKKDNCLRMLGAKLFVIICSNSVTLWTYPTNMNHLGGLCGKYNGKQVDDHTTRQNAQNPWSTYPSSFAATWKTPVQFDKGCLKTRVDNSIWKRPCTEEQLKGYKSTCAEHLKNCRITSKALLITLQSTCGEDLCYNPKQTRKWLEVALELCKQQQALLGT